MPSLIQPATSSQDAMLDKIQRAAFAYFTRETNLENGLVADKTSPGSPCSIAAVGMALTCYPIAVARGFITRADAAERTLCVLRFFAGSDQSGSRTATGYKGFYYHFLDMSSGRRAGRSELSSIDTAILIAGMLTAAAYFETPAETEIRSLADALYRRVEWGWMQDRSDAVCLGWMPERGFLRWHWRGYNEAQILYALGLGSPTYPLSAGAYAAWLSTCKWRNIYGIGHLPAGPLFIHLLSQIWLDLRGIRDAFMRLHDCDYFENTRRAVLVQQAYAIRNARQFAEYGAFFWGLTATDGPGKMTRTIDGRERRFSDYIARGAPFGPDDGTVAPWVAIAALPFAPEIVFPTIENFRRLRSAKDGHYGFTTSVNPTLRGDGYPQTGWISATEFGIDVGLTIAMIEKFRTGSATAPGKPSSYIQRGLDRAGFRAV
jgi:hypothetical protein